MELLAPTLYTPTGRRIAFPKSKKVFNLGSGSQRYENVTGIDIVPGAADIVHDLNRTPWPIPDDVADVILAFHFLEHVDDLPRVMEEIHRIAKPEAKLIAEVPYFRSVLAYQDPTHRRFFTTRTFDYFCQSEGLGRYGYARANFALDYISLGWPSQNKMKGAVKDFLAKHREWYDRYLSRLSAVDILVFELTVIK